MRKRILALLLALVMCLSLLPTAAFAEDVTDTDGTDGTTLTDTPTTGTDDSTGAPTTGKDEDSKDGKSEDGEDADKDADSTEGAAVPAPMVGSAPTPVVLGAAPLLGVTNQESAHTVQGTRTAAVRPVQRLAIPVVIAAFRGCPFPIKRD